ncbi:Intraflagellar transport protein che-13 [Dirofilaria immitis]|nr:Intraflagellar transport protein che-13 [Dirofilaria immitis]
MEGKEDADEKADGQEDRYPAQQYDVYVLSDELNDKLKLLNYEQDYANSAASYRTLSREYFVKTTNIGEQFFIFTTLSAWLIQKAIDPSFAFSQEFNDPNGIILSILDALRSKNVPISFAPNKLKTGAGEHCLYVLDKLADLALVAEQFSWIRADPMWEDDEETKLAVDQAEITTEEFNEDEQINVAADDDSEIVMDLKAVSPRINFDNDVKVSSKFWKLEVERVAPHLKITFEQDSKDWRMHLERMRSLQKSVTELLSTTEPNLKRISNELEKTMERIINRWQFCPYYMIEINSSILERTQKLQHISDELEQIKQQIDEKNLQNNDGVPMLRLKQALQKMESEIMTMNVQISVIEQSLLQSQLKNRTTYNAHFQDLHI